MRIHIFETIRRCIRARIVIALVVAGFFFCLPGSRPAQAGPQVVVYTALDQVYSQPVLERFRAETGIRVRAVYDVEATKTIGLVNRILAERSHPRCDLFWNNEVVNTIRLKQKGVLLPYASPQGRSIPARYRDADDFWFGFAARARVIVYNTSLVTGDDIPATVSALLAPEWKGRTAVAYPLFGTTATHAAALFHLWGDARTLDFIRAFRQNGGVFVDGNSVVRDRVADGTFAWGLTDTDDAYAGMQRGLPIAMRLPDQAGAGTLVIPNTVALIRNGPNPQSARRLMDFLLSAETERMLAASGSGQIPLRPGLLPAAGIPVLEDIRPMELDFPALALEMERVLSLLEKEL